MSDADLDTLTPPETLKAPKAVPSIGPDQGRDMTPLSGEDKTRLDEMARAFVQDVTRLDAHGEGFKRKLDSVHALGMDEQRSAAQVALTGPLLPAARASSGLSTSALQPVSASRRWRLSCSSLPWRACMPSP